MRPASESSNMETERQKNTEAEKELALVKEKQLLNYYELLPGLRIKRWLIIALIDVAIFWGVLLNFELTENQLIILLIACALGPAVWMTWMSKITGVKYFDD